MHVFIVAPTPMMQAGLHTLLTSNDIQVVGTSALPDAFSEITTDIDALVVADELQLEQVGRALAHTRTVALIVLTNNEGRVLPYLRGLELRGWGMVPLDVPAQQLQAAVMAATQGLITLPREQALQFYDRRPVAETLAIEDPDETLTAREREVLDLVGQGLSNKLIARQLQISEHTVKFHVASISNKLGAASRTDAVRRGLRQGLITL